MYKAHILLARHSHSTRADPGGGGGGVDVVASHSLGSTLELFKDWPYSPRNFQLSAIKDRLSLIRSNLFESLISPLCFGVIELYVENLYISWSLISTMQF